MRWHESCLSILAVVCLLVLAACTGGSDDLAVATPAAVISGQPTSTALPEPDAPVPTPTVAPPVVTDQDRVAAVTSAFDAAIEAGEAPEGLIAYDLLDSTVKDDGNVTLNICGWTGDTVFDTVRDSLWRTAVEADGTITATHVTTPLAAGDCLNTHLIDTALATAQQFDALWQEVGPDPTKFGSDPRPAELLTADYQRVVGETFGDLVVSGAVIIGTRQAGPLLDNLVEDVLWRAYVEDEVRVLELVVCRDMDPARGVYRDDVLIDDGRSEGDPGLHSIDLFQLQPDPTAATGWRVAGGDDLLWSDCLSTSDWPGAAGRWREASIAFERLSQ